MTVQLQRNMSTLLAYFGHHKCGTTWIQHIIDHLCELTQLKVVHHYDDRGFNGDIVARRSEQQFDFWCYSNADVTFVRGVPLRGFHVVRDPRDVIVSGYFSHLGSHPDRDWPWLQRHRPFLRSLSKHDGLMVEMEFSALFMSHMLTWDYSNPNILELRFEDVISNNIPCFTRIFSFLGLFSQKITMPQIIAAMAKYSFANLSNGRTRGQEDSSSHYRKGQPGDWRNHFDSSHVDYFKKLYNPLLLKLGYEADEDWNTKAPSSPVAMGEMTTHQQGLQLFQAQKYEEASQLFHRALREVENAERWNDWATAEWFCGRSGQAEMGYRQALRLDPNHSEAVLNLSVVMSSSEQPRNIEIGQRSLFFRKELLSNRF